MQSDTIINKNTPLRHVFVAADKEIVSKLSILIRIWFYPHHTIDRDIFFGTTKEHSNQC
jgi:hypothetical protein